MALLLSLSVAGCGYGSGASSGPNAPNIMQLNPMSSVHGASSFTLTVTGSNFAQDAVVYFNGNPLQSAYGSMTQVSAQVPAADVSSSGMASVYVRTNGQNSNTVAFTIQ
jgi:uncharacterized protein (TIGR03437 family)